MAVRPTQLVASQFSGSTVEVDQASMQSPDFNVKAKKLGRSRAMSSNFSHRDSQTLASHDAMISS